VSGQIHALGALPLGGWVGLKADLDVSQKIKALCPSQKSKISPRPPNPESIHCNDYDVPVPSFLSVLLQYPVSF
jgi:hypothetical protein